MQAVVKCLHIIQGVFCPLSKEAEKKEEMSPTSILPLKHLRDDVIGVKRKREGLFLNNTGRLLFWGVLSLFDHEIIRNNLVAGYHPSRRQENTEERMRMYFCAYVCLFTNNHIKVAQPLV
jgi:hypothetical protein